MENQVPSKPVKAKRTRLDFEPKPELIDDEIDERTGQPANKYARRMKIGKAVITRTPNRVETFGIGNLRVLTTNGIQSELRPESGS